MGIFNPIVKVFELIYEEAEKAWLNEDKYKEALNELYEELENEEISLEEYELREEELLAHLRAIKQYKIENDVED